MTVHFIKIDNYDQNFSNPDDNIEMFLRPGEYVSLRFVIEQA